MAVVAALFSPYARNVWRPSWKAPAAALDERERAVIAKAHARAYELLTGILLLGFLYAWLAMRQGWWLPRDTDGLDSLLRTTLLPLMILPIALAEWSERPPPEDPEEP